MLFGRLFLELIRGFCYALRPAVGQRLVPTPLLSL